MVEIIRGGQKSVLEYAQQPAATLARGAAVQNDWYTVLDTIKNVRIRNIVTRITEAETVEVELTIDGQTIIGSFAQLANTTYRWYVGDTHTDLSLEAISTVPTSFGGLLAFLTSGRSVRVRIRQTTDPIFAGTMYGCVNYEKKT